MVGPDTIQAVIKRVHVVNDALYTALGAALAVWDIWQTPVQLRKWMQEG